jgi:hypothetical protein
MKTKLRKISRKLVIATVAAAIVLAASNSQAQSATNFLSSAWNYLTSVNTNWTWTNVTFEAATGYKQVTGVNAASVVDAQYDIQKFNAGVSAQFSGVGSAINALEGQIGYDIIEYYDTKLEADLRAGYDWNVRTAVIEPAAFLEKKMTQNTFTKIGLSLPVYFKGTFNRTPTVYAEAGFTY